MKHGSLFSGIGGFDIAADWMGWENKFHCEWNKFGQKVLHYYWPKAKQYTDITKSDFMEWRAKIDILTGGFPCQPYSSAGKRLGKEDERHLWPDMLRVILEVQPRWIVGENVLGLTNWNGGVVFEEVQTDLEAQGFEVQAYVLPAAAVNAPHRRDRVWFVAYRNSNGLHSRNCQHEIDASEGGQYAQRDIEQSNVDGDATNTTNIGQEYALENGELERGRSWKSYKRNAWDSFPSVSPVCSRNDGISNQLDGITFSKWRQESIKAAGNAIVPQVVYQIFKTIEEYEHLHRSLHH